MESYSLENVLPGAFIVESDSLEDVLPRVTRRTLERRELLPRVYHRE